MLMTHVQSTTSCSVTCTQHDNITQKLFNMWQHATTYVHVMQTSDNMLAHYTFIVQLCATCSNTYAQQNLVD